MGRYHDWLADSRHVARRPSDARCRTGTVASRIRPTPPQHRARRAPGRPRPAGEYRLAAEPLRLDAAFTDADAHLEVLGLHDIEHLARPIGTDIGAAPMPHAVIKHAILPRRAEA